MTDFFKKIFLSGLGALAVTAEKANEIIDELVKKGEITFDQGKELAKEYRAKLGSHMQEMDKKIEAVVTKVISTMNIATKEDLKKIEDKLEQLQKIINND